MNDPHRHTHRRDHRLVLERLEDRSLLTLFTVTHGGDDGPGSLREAVRAANNEIAHPGPDQIEFAPGVTSVLLNSGPLSISSKLTIHGPATGVSISRDPSPDTPAFRILQVEWNGIAWLENLKLTNGVAITEVGSDPSGGLGGGILNDGSLTLRSSVIEANQAVDGGGLANRGTLQIQDTHFLANSAQIFGGGLFHLDGTASISRSTLSENSADRGGAIQSFSTLTLYDSHVRANEATYGGGLANLYGTLTVYASTVVENLAEEGGGFYNEGSAMVDSSTIWANQAQSSGGGIAHFAGELTVQLCTISGNSSAIGGGLLNLDTARIRSSTIVANGAGMGGGVLSLGNTWIANTIVAGSPSGGDLAGMYAGSNNLIQDGTGGLPDSIAADPLLSPLDDHGGPTPTYALLPDSPAIDAGSDTFAVDDSGMPLANDQRGPGYPRRVGTVDIGSFERNDLLPIAVDDILETDEDTSALIDVLANDLNLTPGALQLSVGNGPELGTVEVQPNGTILYTPFDNANGTDQFSYTLSNDLGQSSTAVITVHVRAINDAPVLSNPGIQQAYEDLPVQILGISVFDVDMLEATDSIRIQIDASAGQLWIDTSDMAIVVEGQGGSALVLEGPIGPVNAALCAGLTYRGAINAHGVTHIQVHADDLGQSGVGGRLTDHVSIPVRILSTREQIQTIQAQIRDLRLQGGLNRGLATALQMQLELADRRIATGHELVAYAQLTLVDLQLQILQATRFLNAAQSGPLLNALDRLLLSLRIGGGF